MNVSRAMLGLFAFAILAALPAAGASHTDDTTTQSWTLHADETMTRDPHSASDTEGSVAIDAGATEWWCADESAVLNFSVLGEQFNARVQLLQANDVRLKIGSCTTEGLSQCTQSTIIGTDASLGPDVPHDVEHARAISLSRNMGVSATSTNPGCVVRVGERLAFGVEAVNGPAKVGTHIVAATLLRPAVAGSAFTFLTPPPAYPTPELPTIALLAVGIIGLVVVKRRS